MKNVTQVYIGVDVSKAFLDVYIDPIGKRLRIENNESELKRFVREISCYKIEQVIFESSGGYESFLGKVLAQAQIKAWCVNPLRICAFKASEGIYAKSDTSDAKVLALFGKQKQCHYEPHCYSKQEQQLKDLVNRRSDLVQIMIGEKARAKGPSGEYGKKSCTRHITFLKKEIARLEEEIECLKRSMGLLCKKAELLGSIPGVGNITAVTLLAMVPELGSINHKQASAIVGVAPYTRRSGTYRGKECIKGGRATPRRTLYMAVLTGVRCNPILKAFYARLIQAGKKPKIALVAVMRKLVCIINAMLRNNEGWRTA